MHSAEILIDPLGSRYEELSELGRVCGLFRKWKITEESGIARCHVSDWSGVSSSRPSSANHHRS